MRSDSVAQGCRSSCEGNKVKKETSRHKVHQQADDGPGVKDGREVGVEKRCEGAEAKCEKQHKHTQKKNSHDTLKPIAKCRHLTKQQLWQQNLLPFVKYVAVFFRVQNPIWVLHESRPTEHHYLFYIADTQ